MDLFDFGYTEELKKDSVLRRIRLLSLFSGIGAFEKALKNLGWDFDLLNYSEIDPYASKAYAAIHEVSEDMNLGDVKTIDTSKLPKDIDLITYGFPCQDISIAGKTKGFWNEDGSITRSGLFFEALRIIKDTQPVVAIAENVKNLMSESFRDIYHTVVESLGEAGYNSYVQILNAKDFGIPQNRERVFIVSIRKDKDMGFEFPATRPLELRLKDLLEDEVDEKYYLSDVMMDYLTSNSEKQKEAGNGFTFSPTDGGGIAKAIVTKEGCQMQNNFITPGTCRKSETQLQVDEASATMCSTLTESIRPSVPAPMGMPIRQSLISEMGGQS